MTEPTRPELDVTDTVGILRQSWVRPERTSSGHGWRGLYLSTQAEQPYQASFPAARTHLVVLHLGGPVVVTHGHGPGAERKAIPTGGFFVHPAGHDLTVALDAPLETIHANLDDAVLAEAANGVRADLTSHLGPHDPMIEQLLLALDGTLRQWEPAARTYVDHLTAMLAAHLVHRYGPAHSAPRTPVTSALDTHQLGDVVDEMKSRLAEPIPLIDLAAVAALSTSQLTRRFKAATGLTPHRYLVRLRLEQAVRELRTSTRPIADVAVTCGFSHQEHLTRTMRAQLGITPAEVRRSA